MSNSLNILTNNSPYLSPPKEWQAAGQHCEGISSEAPLMPLHDTQKELSKNFNGTYLPSSDAC